MICTLSTIYLEEKKMIKKNIYLKIVFVTVLFFFVVANFSVAQENLNDNAIKKIDQMTEKLTNKLLLSEVQTNKIKSLLKDYFKGLQKFSGDGDKLSELRQNSETKILNILDYKQKMKYDIIKKEWWGLASQ